jgi:hypothetical protein
LDFSADAAQIDSGEVPDPGELARENVHLNDFTRDQNRHYEVLASGFGWRALIDSVAASTLRPGDDTR